MFWLKSIDYFFLVFHFGIVVFNLFGWVWKKTRIANLILLILTGGSWFGLGLFYGFGYCPFTDWHWQVLDRLGEIPQETSYMQYLFNRVLGIHINSKFVDAATLISYLIALVVSIILNIHTRRKQQ